MIFSALRVFILSRWMNLVSSKTVSPVSSVHYSFLACVLYPLPVTHVNFLKCIVLSCHWLCQSYLGLLRVLVLMHHGKWVTTPSPSIHFVEAKHIDEWRQVFTLDALPSSLAQYLTTGLVHQLAITAWEEPDWSRLLLLRLGVGHAGACEQLFCVWVWEAALWVCVCERDCD